MRVAHLVRCEGDLLDRGLETCASSVLTEVRRPHPSACSSVVLDLTGSERFSAAMVPRLRELRRAALEDGVVLTVLVRPGSAADRVLDFHLGLGEALPTVHRAAGRDRRAPEEMPD